MSKGRGAPCCDELPGCPKDQKAGKWEVSYVTRQTSQLYTSSSNHPDFPHLPPRPLGAGHVRRGLHCGLTKMYSVSVSIWKTLWTLGAALAQYHAWLETTREYRERSKREYLDDVSDLVEWLEGRCHLRTASAMQRKHLLACIIHKP